jgi:lipopolysaccharide transport system ATP-binding protein
MQNIILKVNNISKGYKKINNPLLDFFFKVKNSKITQENFYWALKNITFEVYKGESIGIIGKNGAGKSTLLSILAGVLIPTSGTVDIKERVTALLELGSGFNPILTGYDNALLNGILLGLTKSEILSRMNEIEDFADIGTFMHKPISTYSSGMVVRLAFAVQIICKPQILIIDEALSVGDFFFQQKCLKHIQKLKDEGLTLIFVSHDMNTVRDFCQRVIFLKNSQIEFIGNSSDGIQKYYLNENKQSNCNKDTNINMVHNLLWKSSLSDINKINSRLISVSICDENETPKLDFKIGDLMIIFITFYNAEPYLLHPSVEIINKYDQLVTSTGSSRIQIPKIKNFKEKSITLKLSIQMMIEAGKYSIIVRLGKHISANMGENVDFTNPLGPININWNYETCEAPFHGMVGLKCAGQYLNIDE